MSEEKKEEKKIIVDEDWKEEAKKEKESIAASEKVEKQQAEKQKGERGPLPPGDFAALISMLTTQAFFSLGLLQVEGQDKKEPDFQLAKYNIDMLETLEEKTKGNLTEQESKVLSDTLAQLRIAYVKMSG